MRAALLALLLAAGCSRQPEAPKGKAVYESKKGAFTLQGPADWRVLEEQGGTHHVSFLGPPPDVEMISVYRPEGTDPRGYLAAAALGAKSFVSPRENELIVERETPVVHGKPLRKLTVRTVVIPDEKGFWALVHTAPSGRASAQVFDDVVKTFKPR